ncbi:MAG: hypothetical protein AB7O44_32610 [Hyphomicrobiaceae bacterium]
MVKSLGLPVKFSQTPSKVKTGDPVHGEHSRDANSDMNRKRSQHLRPGGCETSRGLSAERGQEVRGGLP